MLRKFVLLVFLVLSTQANAEIEYVDIFWLKEGCTPACAEILEKRLNAIKEVSHAEVNREKGRARLFWKPESGFSYSMIRPATSFVGIGLSQMSIKARGTIAHDSRNTYLISLGDRTKFQILSPVDDNPDLYITKKNRAVNSIKPSLEKQLHEVEDRDGVVTISGPLFQYYRPPLSIIAEKVSASEREMTIE